MTKALFTIEELESAVTGRRGDIGDFLDAASTYGGPPPPDGGAKILIRGEEYTLVEIYSEGGEGEGDRYFIVFEVVGHELWYRFNGYYSSYDGVDWDSYSVERVELREVTVKQWQTLEN